MLSRLTTRTLSGVGLLLVGLAFSHATLAYAAEPDPDLHYPIFSDIVDNETTATFPGTGAPTAEVDSNRTLLTASSATLGADTPFGQVFGSSAGKEYLRVDVKAAETNTTTITFSRELQANQLGIALGDIDAERVVVGMTNDAEVALTPAEMGARDGFNYAGNPDIPSTTADHDNDTHTVADTRCVDAQQECDTQGATAWFQPTAPVKTITLTGTKISGFPEYQLWLAYEDYQRVTWTPTTSLDLEDDLPATFAAATTSGDGAMSYAVADAGSTGCTVDSDTLTLTANAAGTCLVTATAAATDDFLAGSTTIAFIIEEKQAQSVTWSPTTTITLSEAPLSFAPDDLPNSTGNGTKSYSVADAGSAQCSVNSSTGIITAQSLGTCQITATAAETDSYAEGSTTVTFTFVAPAATSNNSDDNDDPAPVVTLTPGSPELAATGTSVTVGIAWSAGALTLGALLWVLAATGRQRLSATWPGA
jgi:hypothetical protein